MMSPAATALAMITVMLWIIWSDTIRRQKPSQVLYGVRVVLFLVVSAVLIANMLRYPAMYNASARVVTIVAVLVGIGGSGYFVKKTLRR